MGSILNKEAYDYASKSREAKSGGNDQRRANNLWRVANELLESELAQREGTRQFTIQTGNKRGVEGVRGKREGSDRSAQEAQTPDPVRVTAVHFSKQQRSNLSTSFAGTGYAGAERNRLPQDKKSPINQRLYGYVNAGYGPVSSVNRPVRTRKPGGVGTGGEKPPATRLCCN